MDDYQNLTNYFSEYLSLINSADRDKVVEVFKLIPNECNYYEVPAASGNHHSALQRKVHGLMYHIYDGLTYIEQMSKSYKLKSDEISDLYTAYLLHDICKYKKNPSGTNYTHDEDAYRLVTKMGFSERICALVRYAHGQWSTHKGGELKEKYKYYINIIHIADMCASRTRDTKLISSSTFSSLPDFSKSEKFSKKNETDADGTWW